MPNIRTLFNFEPPVTDDEIRPRRSSSCGLTGFNRPSQVNEKAFNRAVDEIRRRRACCSTRW